jgi:hypothetical protein
MKKIFLAIIFILAFAGCEHDQETNAVGKISFSVDNAKSNSDGRTADSSTPAAVLLDIETSTGTTIYSNKKISLYSFGSSYASESLELPAGNYKLTKFIVLNSDNVSIFATPLAGSALANLVSKPLPISFAVTANGITQVVPEVLPVSSTNDPAQFGYISFGFTVKKRILSKTLFEFDSSKNSLVPSWKDVYKFDGLLLKEINSFDLYNNTTILWSRKFFDYNETDQLSMIRFQPTPNGNYFHVKVFDYTPTEAKITMYEMTDAWKSVESYMIRKNTNSNVQLIDNYRTIDYAISNGNLVSLKLSDKPHIVKMEYDNHINPDYFIDEITELSYVNTELGSKNNLIKETMVENGIEKTVLNVAITYDADGYPLTRTYEYATGEKFRYSYTYQ